MEASYRVHPGGKDRIIKAGSFLIRKRRGRGGGSEQQTGESLPMEPILSDTSNSVCGSEGSACG